MLGDVMPSESSPANLWFAGSADAETKTEAGRRSRRHPSDLTPKGAISGPLRILRRQQTMTSNSKPKPQAKTSQAEHKPAPAIIVFGADEANKPRAATFTGEEVEAATKAAELMKLGVLKVAGPKLTELATHLERGRIYASGHGFVP